MSRETSENDSAGGGSNFVPGLLVGIAVGGILGLLLAPRPGRETAGMLLDKAEGVGGRILDWVADTREAMGVPTAKKSKTSVDGR